MPTSGPKKRRKLFRLWHQDPRCHYCGRDTILVMVPSNHRMPKRLANDPLRATLEHLRSRLHKKRREPIRKGERRIVLACNECNHKKGREDQEALPKSELQKRSGRGPLTYSVDFGAALNGD